MNTQLDRTLAFLGYATLDDFFACPDWQRVQAETMRRCAGKCARCGAPAVIVRPLDFTIATLRGKHKNLLESICEQCVGDLKVDDYPS